MGKRTKLPNRIIVLPNKDKEFHEKWNPGRNMLNFPHPFRAVFLGPPNVGKGNTLKNLIMRSKPAFEEIFCIHCDPEFTQEWNDCDVQMLAEIPEPGEWEGAVKTLVILDDLEFKGMSKIQRRNLDRLYGFVSTHKNISVILCSQDCFNVPPIVRRCSNLWVLWKTPDLDAMSLCARKAGMNKKDFLSIFSRLLPSFHDSLWIDMTSKTPYPLRKNGFEMIEK